MEECNKYDLVEFKNKIISEFNNTVDRYNSYKITNSRGLLRLEYFPVDTVYEIIDKAFDEYIKNKEKE